MFVKRNIFIDEWSNNVSNYKHKRIEIVDTQVNNNSGRTEQMKSLFRNPRNKEHIQCIVSKSQYAVIASKLIK